MPGKEWAGCGKASFQGITGAYQADNPTDADQALPD